MRFERANDLVEVALSGIHEIAARGARIVAMLADDNDPIDTVDGLGHGTANANAVFGRLLPGHVVVRELIDIEGHCLQFRLVPARHSDDSRQAGGS